MNNDIYQNPLENRYGTKEMLYIFSNNYKISTWRKLWVVLAESQMELGLNITQKQIDALKKAQTNINYSKALEYEAKFDHEVMAHIHAFGEEAKEAKGIIHLGATSAYVLDNTDIIQIKDGLNIIKQRLKKVIANLSDFALKYKALPTLAFTHLQPAQLTTVGKRATLWIESLRNDFNFLTYVENNLALRGLKGTTGTAASFKTLFNNNYNKYIELENLIAKKLGFSQIIPVTGQTYDRKIDVIVLELLANIAQSSHKFTNDLRILQSFKELEEPFSESQIGSSAMPYKRNPIKSERISSIAKFVISLVNANISVASTQWLERTLDDSANKRLSLPQAFLAVDSILDTWEFLSKNLVVYNNVINKHIQEELPFMATETIMMKLVQKGKDRQEAHEKLRELSMIAGKNVKINGSNNNLIDLIKVDCYFKDIVNELDDILKPENFIGFSIQQTENYIEKYIKNIIN